MAKSRARTGCLVGAAALILTLVVAGVLGGVLLSRTQGVQRALVARYEEVSVTSQARTYPRADDPPGWTLEPGDAASLYQEAWGICDLEQMPDDAKDGLHEALRAYAGDLDRQPHDGKPPFQAPGSHPLPEPCRSAGIPDHPDDLVIAQLTPATCGQYAACWPALELIRRGTRQADATSPMHLWSSWSAVDGGPELRTMIPFLELARMELLAGHVAGLHGDPWAPAESAITTLRFGQDVGQGAGLIGTMVGVAIQRQAADVLAGLIASDALPPAERARLRDELHYVNRHTFSVTEAIESEFLVLGALWVHGEVSVPPTALLPTGEEALTERVMMARLADDHLRLADELLPRLDAPFPERLEAYDAYVEGMDDPWMAPDYARYDIQLTASRSRLLLLEIAAADGAFRAAQGRPPADLDELAKATPTLPRTDPLTADAFVLETVGGVRTLRSAAPGADGDPARLAQTGTSWNYDRMLQLELPAEATPIP